MSRICIEKSTGKLIEMQSNATEGTLIKNALNAGYKVDEIEERSVTPEEWAVYEVELRRPILEQIEAGKIQADIDRQVLLDDLNNATTIAGLKNVIRTMIGK